MTAGIVQIYAYDFSVDDEINIILPKTSDTDVLLITNEKQSYLQSALYSLKSLNIKKEEPPIVDIGNEKLIILENVDYNSLLPGTIEEIKSKVKDGSSLIIAAQDKLSQDKLSDILPLELNTTVKQDTEILNTATLEKYRDFNFGVSSVYFEASSKNSTIVIAEANDKFDSPVIALSKYGLGNVFYYSRIFAGTITILSKSQYSILCSGLIPLNY